MDFDNFRFEYGDMEEEELRFAGIHNKECM